MKTTDTADPFAVLGVPADAGEDEIRTRYLELVKQFPPDREPDRFRAIRSAYEAARDPLQIASRLLEIPEREAPSWSDALDEQKKIPPPLSRAFLVSLGNRHSEPK